MNKEKKKKKEKKRKNERELKGLGFLWGVEAERDLRRGPVPSRSFNTGIPITDRVENKGRKMVNACGDDKRRFYGRMQYLP